MTVVEIKNILEAKKCPKHRKRPLVIISNGEIQKIHGCCEAFLRKLRSDADYLLGQMDKEQFQSATEPVQMTAAQYKRAAKRILHLQKLIQDAHQALADPNIQPITIYKSEIEEAVYAYDRIARSANRANDSLLGNREEVIAEAERLKPLVSQATRAYSKMQLAKEKEKQRLIRERKKIEEQARKEKQQDSRRRLLNITEATGIFDDARFLDALVSIKALKDSMEKASLALNDSSKPPQRIDSIILRKATRAYEKIEESYRESTDVWKEKNEVLGRAKSLQTQIEEAFEAYKRRVRAVQKKQERMTLEKRTARDERLRALADEKKRKEAAQKRQEAKTGKERIKIIQTNMPKWVKSVEAAQKFIEENDSQSYLALLSKDDLRRVVMVANALLEAMIPLRNARSEKIIGSDYADLLRAYNIAHDKLLKIIEICSGLISRKSVSNRKRTIEKQKSNKREDSSYFRKMFRLYDDRINASDKWYENESRRFNINRHEDVREYLDAYGRTIRNNLLKAEVVVEGREDVDEWGYFNLGDKYLPYCLREVKVVYDNIEYHLYTFNTMTSMDDYDYDGMITDRIFYLRDRGIKTN